MELDMSKLPGILLIVGSGLFMIAAFLPITVAFVQGDTKALRDAPGAWAGASLLFVLGTLVTGAGLGLLATQVGTGGAAVAYVSVALFVAAAVFWAVITYLRLALPIEQVLASPTFGWPFVAYTLLMNGALIGMGIALLLADYPRWIGWATVGLPVALAVTYLVAKDMPPFAHFGVTLALGVALLVLR